jgi:hypothetical protein
MRRPDERARAFRDVAILFAAAWIAGVRVSALADQQPYPIFTADHFVIAMKTVGQAFTATNAAVTRNQTDDAKAYLAISRDRLATTITFWRDRRRDDAVTMLRTALARMDELDAALSAERVDTDATSNLAKQIGEACEACHQTYREQDPATKKFRFRNVTEHL